MTRRTEGAHATRRAGCGACERLVQGLWRESERQITSFRLEPYACAVTDPQRSFTYGLKVKEAVVEVHGTG